MNVLKAERDEWVSKLEKSRSTYASREMELKGEITAANAIIQEKESGMAKMIEKMTTFDIKESELLSKIVMQEAIRRSLHNRVIQLSGNIRVFVRVRPIIASEQASVSESSAVFSFPTVFDKETPASSSAVKVGDDLTKQFIVVTEPPKDRGGLSQRRKKIKFGFDGVFSPTNNQDNIWKATEPLIQSAVDGYNVCVFAYGQTGSGKTYTMLGGGNEANSGIINKAISKLFDEKHLLEDTSKGLTTADISVELFEIYNEQVRDLMSMNKDGSYNNLNISDNANEVIGNKVLEASCKEEIYSILARAQKRRCVKATKSNEESSRSHFIFTLNFVVRNASGILRKSKLNICDLAGSERLSKSQAVGSTLNETKHINKSLSTLSNVIEKLQNKEAHVPFRESKLTYLLRNSLGGDSKTLAIVCCSPIAQNFQETSCSLRFAQKLNKVELKAIGKTSC